MPIPAEIKVIRNLVTTLDYLTDEGEIVVPQGLIKAIKVYPYLVGDDGTGPVAREADFLLNRQAPEPLSADQVIEIPDEIHRLLVVCGGGVGEQQMEPLRQWFDSLIQAEASQTTS
ncbi:hypothetical protein A3A66_04485 [Microgenomates group bacterium RIFCSPLOWO2_01_FULL_46_13]|nr:MAG: hypothetical protein A2783_04965 [Microgenomates group bacterium RIFCSPHIGHO2_01_FULL_45_11]OGV94227.1 MAG: hypothetical protein A3A66_04485 [Microgenomates group bacterium RIFCSPLOWO2_01_FULL_46_13]